MKQASKELKQDLETVDKSCSVEVLCDGLGIKTMAGREFVRQALANALLMDRKQQDYGSGNISAFGAFGVVVRLSDKKEHLMNLKGLVKEVKNQVKRFIQTCQIIEKNQLTMSQLEVMTQLNDSFESLKTLFKNRRRRVHNESIVDSWRDTSNYGTIGQMVELGLWPDE